MAYNEKLARRIRVLIGGEREFVEKKMFGGVAFMLRGRMCCGVLNDDLVARICADRAVEALAEPHVRPMDFTGRVMKVYVSVGPAAVRARRRLQRWVERCLAHAASL